MSRYNSEVRGALSRHRATFLLVVVAPIEHVRRCEAASWRLLQQTKGQQLYLVFRKETQLWQRNQFRTVELRRWRQP